MLFGKNGTSVDRVRPSQQCTASHLWVIFKSSELTDGLDKTSGSESANWSFPVLHLPLGLSKEKVPAPVEDDGGARRMERSYPRLGWISMKEVSEAHRRVATELSVDVVPVGLAWHMASGERPWISSNSPDHECHSVSGLILRLVSLTQQFSIAIQPD